MLASQAEAIVLTVRSLTNMAATDPNGYLKSNYMLNTSIMVELNITLIRTFTCELLQNRASIFKQSHNAAMFVGEASRRLQRLLLF